MIDPSIPQTVYNAYIGAIEITHGLVEARVTDKQFSPRDRRYTVEYLAENHARLRLAYATIRRVEEKAASMKMLEILRNMASTYFLLKNEPESKRGAAYITLEEESAVKGWYVDEETAETILERLPRLVWVGAECDEKGAPNIEGDTWFFDACGYGSQEGAFRGIEAQGFKPSGRRDPQRREIYVRSDEEGNHYLVADLRVGY